MRPQPGLPPRPGVALTPIAALRFELHQALRGLGVENHHVIVRLSPLDGALRVRFRSKETKRMVEMTPDQARALVAALPKPCTLAALMTAAGAVEGAVHLPPLRAPRPAPPREGARP